MEQVVSADAEESSLQLLVDLTSTGATPPLHEHEARLRKQIVAAARAADDASDLKGGVVWL